MHVADFTLRLRIASPCLLWLYRQKTPRRSPYYGHTYHGYTYHGYTYHGYTYHGYTYYGAGLQAEDGHGEGIHQVPVKEGT